MTFIIFITGDDYEVVKVNVSNLERSGVDVTSCDYYEYLKCYCLAINGEIFPNGIQSVHLNPPHNNIDIIAFVVPPGKFYDSSRKLNKLEIQHGSGYEYVIKYDIFKILNLKKRPCNSDISWKEDNCKIKKVKLVEK